MNFTIYTFGNGDVLFDIFTSIVLMTGTGYESLMRLGLVCLAFGGITYYVARGRVAMQLFMGGVMVLFTMVTIKASVTITDLVNPGVPTRVVGNVPLAVAFPAYMASEVGFQLLSLSETAFALTVPAEYQMMNSTFARGYFDFQKTLGAQLPDGDLQANVTQYLVYCVFPSISMNQLQKGTIFSSPDVLTAFQVNNGALMVQQIVNGNPFTNMSCPDMYNGVIVGGMQDGNPDYDIAMRQLRRSLNVQDVPGQELVPIGQFVTNIINTGQGARQLVNNVLLRERWVDAERIASALGSDTATSVSLMQRQISEDLKTQAFAQSSVAARFLPMMRTMAESGVYMLTPFVLALAMTPAMFATIRMAAMSYAWLLFWAPIYAMVNYLVYAYGNGQIQGMVPPGTGLTFASYTDFYDVLSQLNSFAANVIWGVPTIASIGAMGMGSAASALLGGTHGAQQAAAQEATAFAHGHGASVDPGRHIGWQEDASIDDDNNMTVGHHIGGQGSMMVEDQYGGRTFHYSDGGVLEQGRNGISTYHGPRGSYSEDASGRKISGAYREEMYDERIGQSVDAQFEVSGDHVDMTYAYQDSEGNEHAVHEVRDQGTGGMVKRADTSFEGNMAKTVTTGPDNSKNTTQAGFVPVTVVDKEGNHLQDQGFLEVNSGENENGDISLGPDRFASSIDKSRNMEGRAFKQDGGWFFQPTSIDEKKGTEDKVRLGDGVATIHSNGVSNLGSYTRNRNRSVSVFEGNDENGNPIYAAHAGNLVDSGTAIADPASSDGYKFFPSNSHLQWSDKEGFHDVEGVEREVPLSSLGNLTTNLSVDQRGESTGPLDTTKSFGSEDTIPVFFPKHGGVGHVLQDSSIQDGKHMSSTINPEDGSRVFSNTQSGSREWRGNYLQEQVGAQIDHSRTRTGPMVISNPLDQSQPIQGQGAEYFSEDGRRLAWEFKGEGEVKTVVGKYDEKSGAMLATHVDLKSDGSGLYRVMDINSLSRERGEVAPGKAGETFRVADGLPDDNGPGGLGRVLLTTGQGGVKLDQFDESTVVGPMMIPSPGHPGEQVKAFGISKASAENPNEILSANVALGMDGKVYQQSDDGKWAVASFSAAADGSGAPIYSMNSLSDIRREDSNGFVASSTVNDHGDTLNTSAVKGSAYRTNDTEMYDFRKGAETNMSSLLLDMYEAAGGRHERGDDDIFKKIWYGMSATDSGLRGIERGVDFVLKGKRLKEIMSQWRAGKEKLDPKQLDMFERKSIEEIGGWYQGR